VSFRQSLVTLFAATSSDRVERLGPAWVGAFVGTAVSVIILTVLANLWIGVIAGVIVGALVGALSSRQNGRIGRGTIAEGLIGGVIGPFVGTLGTAFVGGWPLPPGQIVSVGFGLVFGAIDGALFGLIVSNATYTFVHADLIGVVAIIAGMIAGGVIGFVIGGTYVDLIWPLLLILIGGSIGGLVHEFWGFFN
jgi:hypothetical protein